MKNQNQSPEWDILKNIRESHGLSVAALAERAGVSQATVYSWEKHMPPSFANLAMMAEALETTPSQLLGFQIDAVRDATVVTPPIVSEALARYRDDLYAEIAEAASGRDYAKLSAIVAKIGEIEGVAK